jgi:N-methylhydantoinase A
MVRAVRAVSAERGHDPRDATLVAFGGNGPLHAAAVARELGIPLVLAPPMPGVFSALGLVAAGVEHHFLRTHLRPLERVDRAALQDVLREMAATAHGTLAPEGYPADRVALEWAADARYLGQSFELTVPLTVDGDDRLGDSALTALEAAFHTAHERAYGHAAPADPVELVNIRLVARGLEETPRGLPATRAIHASVAEAPVEPTSSRDAYFGPAHGWLHVHVLPRAALRQAVCAGPAIVEEYDATTVIPPGWLARLDASGSIALERAA